MRLLPALVLLAGACAPSAPPADLVVFGRVWTGDTAHPSAGGIAVRGDTIVAVGDSAEIARLVGGETEVLANGDGLVTPGFADAHTHFTVESKRGRLQAIVSSDAREGSLHMRQDAVLYAGLFDGAERAQLEIPPARLVFVHVARGALSVQGRALGPGDGFATSGGTIVLERGRDAEALVFDLPGD